MLVVGERIMSKAISLGCLIQKIKKSFKIRLSVICLCSFDPSCCDSTFGCQAYIVSSFLCKACHKFCFWKSQIEEGSDWLYKASEWCSIALKKLKWKGGIFVQSKRFYLKKQICWCEESFLHFLEKFLCYGV